MHFSFRYTLINFYFTCTVLVDKYRGRDSTQSRLGRKYNSIAVTTVYTDIKDRLRDLKRPLENMMTFSKRIMPFPSFKSFLWRSENVVLVPDVLFVQKSEEKLTLIQWHLRCFLFLTICSSQMRLTSRLIIIWCLFSCRKVAFLWECAFEIKKVLFHQERPTLIKETKTSCIQ